VVGAVRRRGRWEGARERTFQAGDRVRWSRLVGDDGLPVVRYGFVGGVPDGSSGGRSPVMLDGEL
jgi:hypothetical protein